MAPLDHVGRSDRFFLASVGGRSVAFLPRHGRRHTIPPHKVPYRANVWAMRSLGVKAVISPCAAGSLQPARTRRSSSVCSASPQSPSSENPASTMSAATP